MTAFIQTIERRSRYSDGTAVCDGAGCGKTLDAGSHFTTVSPGRNLCDDCMNKDNRGDVTTTLVVVASSLGLVAALAAVLAG